MTARPRWRNAFVPRARTRSIGSHAEPPEDASWLVTESRYGTAVFSVARVPAARLPGAPPPVRYVMRMLFEPRGTIRPARPSPKAISPVRGSSV